MSTQKTEANMGYIKIINGDGTVEEHNAHQKGWTGSNILTSDLQPDDKFSRWVRKHDAKCAAYRAERRKGALELADDLRKMNMTEAKAEDARYGKKVDEMIVRWDETRGL